MSPVSTSLMVDDCASEAEFCFHLGNSGQVRVRYSSVVEPPLVMQWAIGSIPHGGLTELFLVPASAS